MRFLEFIDHIAISLPSNIIKGKISNISYRTNPVKITIKDGNKSFNALFHDRYIYDKIVGKQKPEVGKIIVVHLDHNNNVKWIKIN